MAEVFFSFRHANTYYASFDAGRAAADAELVPCNANVGPDPVLGYGPLPRPLRMQCVKMRGNTVLYDATYTSLDTGWRVTPQHGDTADTAVLFFGCSFTHGEGLADADSYPYRVGELLGPGYQVFNLGFGGYGSHQMLAEIESGRLDAIFRRYRKAQIYYLTIEAHVERSGGFALWDRDSRRYALDQGRVIDTGTFRDHLSSMRRLAEWVFGKSFVFGLLCNRPSQTERERITALHLAILEKCDRLLREKYGHPLVVLLWPGAEAFADPLRRAGVDAVELAPLFPGYRDKSDPYRIKNDGHPNAKAASLLADMLAARIRSAAAN